MAIHTYRFETLGCKVNQYDTQVMRESLRRLGVSGAQGDQPADLVVLNTCTVTEKSDRKSRYLIRRLMRENPGARLVVTGCYAGVDGTDLLKMPEVSATLGPSEEKQLSEVVGKWIQEEATTGSACTDIPDRLDRNQMPIQEFSGRTRAYLKVQEGCNYRCSFCKVRIARGQAYSRPFAELVQEAKGLVQSGHPEIVLVGIQLGYYGRDFSEHIELADLVEALQVLPGLNRIRLSSIEPRDVSTRLMDLIGCNESKLCDHVHMPWQSGDDSVLERMRRSYRRDELVQIVHDLRRRAPQVAITTDVMVGFPGESEAAFQNTLNLVKELKPSRVHVFPFSARQGTPAEHFGDSISALEKKSRVHRLMEVSSLEAKAFYRRFIGHEVHVLVEGPSDQPPFQQGYTSNYIRVHFEAAKPLEGQLIRARIQGVSGDFVSASTVPGTGGTP